MRVPRYTLQHYLQWPEHGNNLNVHQQKQDKEEAVHLYNEILLSSKKEQTAIYSDLNGPETVIRGKSVRERQIYDITYMQNIDKRYKRT